jgi:glycosyltransferase involved in cell wall biosynthesis
MTRILHIISDTNIGGAGRVLLNYLAFRDDAEFEISVALPRGSLLLEREELRGVTVYELDGLRDKSFDLKAIKILKKLIRTAQPDIVHTHGAFSGRIAAKQCGVHVVFTRHSAFAPNKYVTSGLGKILFRALTKRYADRIIAVSPVCRDALLASGVPPGMIDVVLNGTPPLEKLTPEKRAAARERYGVAHGEFAIGILARVEPYKGHMYLLDAAKLLLDRGHAFKVLIAGTGEYEPQVRERAKELGLGETVKFLGFVSEIDEFLGALDMQVNASTVEATSLSLLEGMSIGLPAIASNDGGNPLVIADGENGLLFKSRDARMLAELLQRVMESGELREKLSRGAKEIYARDFTGVRTARETEDTYRKVLAK